MIDTTLEELLLLGVQERHVPDALGYEGEHILLGVVHELAAEVNPHGDFLVVKSPLVLAKLHSAVSAVGARVDLMVAVTMKAVVHVRSVGAIGEIVAADGLSPAAVLSA